MNRKSLLFLVIFILSISLATAVELEIEHSGQDYVPTGAEANFEVSVKNLGYRTEIFNVHSDPMANLPSSIFEYILIDNNRLELQSQETIKINIKVKLKKDIKSDENYGTYIMFETPDNKFKKKHNFILRVVPPEDLVVLKVSAPNKVKPKSLYQFSVELENNLNAKLQNVKLLISSELFNEEKELRLFPLQQRTETFSFSIDAGALPKDYDLSIRVVYNDEILKQAVSKFQVLENTDVKQKKEFESGFLTKTYSITKTNYGNTIVEEAYTLKLTYFQKLFASYNENPALIDEQGLHWHYAVNPDSTYTITATVNYRPLFIAFFIVIVFIILVYLWLSRGVSIKKEIIKVRETSEGITEVKILLHLKNKSSRTIRFLKIVEILPTVLEPIKDFGTLKPEKIQKGRKGVRLMWVIPELVKGEERIISYKAKSKINIIGTFLLLPAKIRYKNIGGKAITINSNRPSFTVTTAQEN